MALELLWRQRSHASMFLAGGLCFTLLGKLRQYRLPRLLRSGIGAGLITAVELGTGLAWNRDHRIWDYRGLPGNLWGQICPLFALLWLPLAFIAMELYPRLEHRLP